MIDFKKEYKACINDIGTNEELKKRLITKAEIRKTKILKNHTLSKGVISSAAALAAAVIAVSGLFLLKPENSENALNTKVAVGNNDLNQNYVSDNESKTAKQDSVNSKTDESENVLEPSNEKKVKKILKESGDSSKKSSSNGILAKSESEKSKFEIPDGADVQKETFEIDSTETQAEVEVEAALEAKTETDNEEIALFSEDNGEKTSEPKIAGGGGISVARTVFEDGFKADFGFCGKETKVSFEEYLKNSVGLSIKSEFEPVFENCFLEYTNSEQTADGAEIGFGDFGLFISKKSFSVFKNGKYVNLVPNQIQNIDGSIFRYEQKDGYNIFLYSDTLSEKEFSALDIFE